MLCILQWETIKTIWTFSAIMNVCVCYICVNNSSSSSSNDILEESEILFPTVHSSVPF